ncbi:GntR family transcriptional regulator [Streptomyces sp. PKU-MA01144]|uniref:GntR family transcriptional regulator n=1 Tax=Streptomyces sp. PKU-MA01144 TaxID=2729138 RepID=UPI001480B8CC|nr:GntR family transcriptional regulator [Streptomyces sp. PKU-MA01144]NNJ03048.1 GntR family transcriptional regulator [Streptomyces sp. PKU-MA01144]
MSQEASPRGTFLKIADAVRAEIDAKPDMAELPSAAELMREYDVSRGVALRVFGVLEKEGRAERVPGGRWRVVRPGQERDRRPLVEQINEVIHTDGLAVGDKFPSTGALAERFGVARPTVTKALNKLESAGVLSASQQGKQRTVLALPGREERA